MGEKKTYTLEYMNESKEMDVKVFDIHFISSYFIKRYDELRLIPEEVKEYSREMLSKAVLMSAIIAEDEKTKETSEKIKSLENEINILDKKIRVYADFPKRKFELFKEIFERNSITDSDLLSFDFWDKNVDYAEQAQIFHDIISKDISKKKHQLAGNIPPGQTNSFPDETFQQ